MKGKKTSGKLSAPGKRTFLNLAVPQPLKQKLVELAQSRGWSLSNDAVFRLETSFEKQGLLAEVLKYSHPVLAEMATEFLKLGQRLPPERMDALMLFVRAQVEAELKASKERAKK